MEHAEQSDHKTQQDQLICILALFVSMQYDISSGDNSARKVEPHESNSIRMQNSAGTGCLDADRYHIPARASACTLYSRTCDHFVPGRHAVAAVIRHRRLQKWRHLPTAGMAHQPDRSSADCRVAVERIR